MTRKLVIGLSATLVAAFSISAQFTQSNARISSLADIYTIEDINNVYRYAANMSKYGDDIQVTFSTPMLGIKSLGDAFLLGAYVRNGLVLDADFYSKAIGQVNQVGATPPNLTQPTNMPHALFGVKAGPVTLGFDAFLEWAYSRSHSETKTGTIVKTDAKKRLSNPGLIASALFDLNSMPLSLKVGFSVPTIKGTTEVENGTTTKHEYKSDRGIYLEGGAEAGLNIGGARLTPGIDFIHEGYAFKVDTLDPANSYSINRLAVYAGLQNKAFTNGLWAVQYQFLLNAYKNDAKAEATPDVTSSTITHILSACLENGWDNVWIFDKVFARGGVALDIRTPYTNQESNASESNEKGQKMFSAAPTVGFGVNKGPFELDLRVNMAGDSTGGGWDKLFTGPGVALVTGTLRF